MKRSAVSVIILVAVLISTTVLAWSQAGLETPAVATLTRLFPPIYPRLAQQARISGVVRICLQLRKDGTVESTEVVDGHPMLVQAALDSAQKSIFECGDCGQAKARYLLVYSFEIRDGCHSGPHCDPSDIDKLVISQSPGRVALSVGSLCTCDPTATLIRFRSARCLYLWKCGRREVPND